MREAAATSTVFCIAEADEVGFAREQSTRRRGQILYPQSESWFSGHPLLLQIGIEELLECKARFFNHLRSLLIREGKDHRETEVPAGAWWRHHQASGAISVRLADPDEEHDSRPIVSCECAALGRRRLCFSPVRISRMIPLSDGCNSHPSFQQMFVCSCSSFNLRWSSGALRIRVLARPSKNSKVFVCGMRFGVICPLCASGRGDHGNAVICAGDQLQQLVLTSQPRISVLSFDDRMLGSATERSRSEGDLAAVDTLSYALRYCCSRKRPRSLT